ncbi:lipase member H-A [Amyelois transitella]|uniref:lipase member H-A n=1 Tax=Amyelois transitella TaxID=680683 RepID=UPI00299005AD|nr:lipase member H-A [Amyelois transitella]
MKLLCGLSFVLTVCSARIREGPSNSERYFYVGGDDDNKLTMIDLEEPVDEEFIKNYTSDPDKNGYWLFTRANPLTPQILKYNDTNSVKHSNLDKNKITVVLVHGWRGSCTNEFSTMLTEGIFIFIDIILHILNFINIRPIFGSSFLQDQDVNVIVMDWSALAGQNYVTAAKGTPGTGRCLGQFVNWLASLGAVRYETMHIVGFSLGGHLVGNAGKETGGRVQRITALDPAGPGWNLCPERLNKTDGQYVEAIHTSLFTGLFAPIGYADFYPNGGIIQPGCVSDICGHSRSYQLMAASIKFNHFESRECGSIINVELDLCAEPIEFMGNSYLRPKSPGLFRVNTKGTYPYVVSDLPSL